MEQHRFRRPAMLTPEQAEAIVGEEDPAARSEIAHTTAQAMVSGGREGAEDPELVERLIALVDTEGLEAVAEIWSQSPPDTLPGALWRLYLLREWGRRDPDTIAERFRLGANRAEVAGVVAGVADPVGPEEIRRMLDAVLSGVYRGDLGVALERAGSFLRVLATGSALDADWVETHDADTAQILTRRAGSLLDTAAELEEAASLHRAGRLT
ncbi:hypothetical protein ACO0LV_03355 [Pseudactinotalea sp. Z1739]|uniref:hypothetical protein n=1 Tax=Pseudactinotalea sp. Z1739 TaxID=3413028 RepID=UPI003C7BBFD5